MGKVLRVLLIEDEQDNINLWTDTVGTHNADSDTHGFSIDTEVARSVEEATRLLEIMRFDAAVVDLRLQGEAVPIGPDDDGNLLVKKILETRPLGIVIYSGQGGDAAEFGYPQIKVISRGDGLQPVLEWLKEQSQLLFHLRTVMEAFDVQAAKVFFNSIWPRWQQWAGSIDDPEVLAKLIARHVVAHAHDSMLHEGGEQVHPEETYFVPPMKPRLDTGDLLVLDEAVWIVVTPRCDMAHEGKVQSVLLAKCNEISERWNELVAMGGKGAKEIAKIVQHERNPKQHFLPQLSDHSGTRRGPWLAQFHDLRVMGAREAHAELPRKRFASLTPQFIPALTERFGSYFSRIGTPDLSSD